MIACDTNIFLHAANQGSPLSVRAREFLNDQKESQDFAVCELILFELYMQLRNPAIFVKPLSAAQSHDYCQIYRRNAAWQIIDFDPAITPQLWQWANVSDHGFRQLIDARIAFTLLHHGVSEFATANVRDFQAFGFEGVWNPLER